MFNMVIFLLLTTSETGLVDLFTRLILLIMLRELTCEQTLLTKILTQAFTMFNFHWFLHRYSVQLERIIKEIFHKKKRIHQVFKDKSQAFKKEVLLKLNKIQLLLAF